MKILIFHDYLDNIGGGERLILTLARELKADIATMDYDPKILDQLGFTGLKIINLGKTIKIHPLKQIQATLKYRGVNFQDKYDYFIISGNWAGQTAKNHHPNIWYCHTPPRVLYDLKNYYLKKINIILKPFFLLWVSFQTQLDKSSVKYMDKIVTNSRNTQKRIKKYYQRNSEILYTAIDVEKFKNNPPQDYWLSVNRIYPEKNIDLQIDVFRQLPEKNLKIVGDTLDGDHSNKYKKKIYRKKPKNTELLGKISEKKLMELYSNCRGLLCTAMDEDLGVTPIEAQASGKPVVAIREGGYMETIIDGSTGRLVPPDVDKIKEAIIEIDQEPTVYKEACLKNAKKFSTKNFMKTFKKQFDYNS